MGHAEHLPRAELPAGWNSIKVDVETVGYHIGAIIYKKNANINFQVIRRLSIGDERLWGLCSVVAFFVDFYCRWS